jgi:hypothetical protein
MGGIKNGSDVFELSPERVVLAKLLVGVSSRVSRNYFEGLRAMHRDITLSQAEFSRHSDLVMDQMVYELRTWLLKSTHSEMQTLTVRTPKTWFDHLKHAMLASDNRFLIFTAKKLSPPEYVFESKQVETLTRVCPHNNSYFPESGEHTEFLLWKTD